MVLAETRRAENGYAIAEVAETLEAGEELEEVANRALEIALVALAAGEEQAFRAPDVLQNSRLRTVFH